MVTRLDLVVKIEHFSPQNGDEIQARRQNWSFLNQKRWREWGSSSKKSFSHRKMVTRMGLVAKIGAFSTENGDENRPRRQNWAFSTQIGDENRPRRQNWAFPASNWLRDSGSSPKIGISHLKMVTRMGLVAKIKHFSLKIDDEKMMWLLFKKFWVPFLNLHFKNIRIASPS